MSYSDIYIKNINYNNVYSILNILSIKKIDFNLNTHKKKLLLYLQTRKVFMYTLLLEHFLILKLL